MQTMQSNDSKTYSRLFFALWPDEETRQALVALNQTIAGLLHKPVITPPHNLHVTLVFLGNTDEATATLIKQCAADIVTEPFELIFECVNYWQKPKILCLTCNKVPQQVVDLASKLDAVAAQCGLQTDKRPYVPHITLARHASAVAPQTIKQIIWRADAFCLVQSISEQEGVRYQVLQRWPFLQNAVF